MASTSFLAGSLAFLLGGLYLAILLSLLGLGDLRQHIVPYLWHAGALQFVQILIIMLFRSYRHRWLFPVFFGIAIASRLLCIAEMPSLSDDYFRYVWDGKVARAGISPYAYPPEDKVLSSLRDEHFSQINHRDLRTIYPPAAEFLFASAYKIYPRWWAIKVLICGADIVFLVALTVLLRWRKREPHEMLLYGLHPLPLIEFSHSGHIDIVALLLLFLALIAAERQRSLRMTAWLCASIATKYAAAVGILHIVLKGGSRRLIILVMLAFAGLAIVPWSYSPALMFESLLVYGNTWAFNGALFDVLCAVGVSATIARVILLSGALLGLGTLSLYAEDALSFYAAAFAIALACAPTVYPWYVCWILPFACFSRNWFVWTFAGSVQLSYVVWDRFCEFYLWDLPPALRIAEYAPAAAGAFWLLYNKNKKLKDKTKATQQVSPCGP